VRKRGLNSTYRGRGGTGNVRRKGLKIVRGGEGQKAGVREG